MEVESRVKNGLKWSEDRILSFAPGEKDGQVTAWSLTRLDPCVPRPTRIYTVVDECI